MITGVVGRDEPIPLDVSTLINSDQVESIDGFEVALQHNFGDTGFGLIANATFADGSAVYDNSVDGGQFTLQA